MTIIDSTSLNVIASALRFELHKRTGLAWSVSVRTEHLDFQFGCRNSDFVRITQSHNFLDYTTPEAWEKLVQDDADVIQAALDRYLGDPTL